MSDVVRYRAGSDAVLRMSLVEGRSLVEAARAAGMSERTARRRWADLRFRASVEAMRSEVAAQAVGRLVTLYDRAIDTLCELLNEGSQSTRHRAAVSILTIGAQLQADSEFHARIAVLEMAGADLVDTEQAIVADRIASLDDD